MTRSSTSSQAAVGSAVRPVPQPPGQRVLTVDDDPSLRAWIGALLRRLGVEVTEAGCGEEALTHARSSDFDLILLDVNMPGMDGYAVAAALAADRSDGEAGVPIIFLTATDCREDKLRAFEAGAVDYVLKPFEPAELLARVQSALRMRLLVDQLEAQASTDRLTGLLNRAALGQGLGDCLRRLREEPAERFAVLFMDLDRFKLVNDSLGHAVGDELLRHVAQRLRDAAGSAGGCAAASRGAEHMIARNGGDEFVVVLRNVASPQAAKAAGEAILAAAAEPIAAGGHRLRAGGSVGIRWVDDPAAEPDVLLRDADTAMYEAKKSGRGRVLVFEESMNTDALARLELEEQIRVGIATHQFVLHYQPLISAANNRLEHFEALVRWRHPTRGMLLPGAFVPLAEECGLIVPLGNHVLDLACRQVGEWTRRYGAEAPGVNINVAPEQLLCEGFTRLLFDSARRHAAPLNKLGIEVTESTLVVDAERAAAVLQELREHGVTLCIDDFGTGYSSLGTLRAFPFDIIKIDQAFVQGMALDRSSGGIVHAIVGLAWNLNMRVVAEGAETAAHLFQLLALEVDLIQGFAVSRPVEAAAAEAMIQRIDRPFVQTWTDPADRDRPGVAAGPPAAARCSLRLAADAA